MAFDSHRTVATGGRYERGIAPDASLVLEFRDAKAFDPGAVYGKP